jgi:PKHD-type hydroxylase
LRFGADSFVDPLHGTATTGADQPDWRISSPLIWIREVAMFVVFESVLSQSQVRRLREVLLPDGFEDGVKTAHGDAQRVKRNLQFATTHPAWTSCVETVIGAANACLGLKQYAFPIRFTQPLFNLYGEGMHYGKHTDAAMMSAAGWPMRTDYSMTIFLSAPNEYEGGELVFSPDGGASVAAKLDAGSAVVYPSNTLHEVRTVTKGKRLAAIMWMQSALPSEQQRNVVRELDRVRELLDQNSLADACDLLGLARENLVRMFAQP